MRNGEALDGIALATPVHPCTTIANLQHAITNAKALLPDAPKDPAAVRLYFSPVFILPNVLLGRGSRALLQPSASLAACQIIDDDILYLAY